MWYLATDKSGAMRRLRAPDIETAAANLGRALRVTMHRVTGGMGMSGMFQGYRPMPARLGGGLNSHGAQWHIGEARMS